MSLWLSLGLRYRIKINKQFDFIVRSKVKTTAFRRSDLSLKPFAVLSCKDGVSIR